MKKETNGQSAEIQLNRPPLSLIQIAPFLKKRRTLKIGNSLIQRQKQIALLFPKWNFSYNPLYLAHYPKSCKFYPDCIHRVVITGIWGYWVRFIKN